jgi:hypothetical protein
LVVVVRGDVVGGAVAKLGGCLDRAAGGGRPVAVDMDGVGTLDRAALRLLLDAHQRLGARLRVVAESGGPVHAGLDEAGLAHELALHRSCATALAAAASAAA